MEHSQRYEHQGAEFVLGTAGGYTAMLQQQQKEIKACYSQAPDWHIPDGCYHACTGLLLKHLCLLTPAVDYKT